jgi:hypothetical protein
MDKKQLLEDRFMTSAKFSQEVGEDCFEQSRYELY